MSKKLSSLLLVFMIGVTPVYWACQSLDTANLNAPDTERALATPGDVEAIIGGSMLSWFDIHAGWGIEHQVVAADALTCSWGNFGMQDNSSEPRAAFNNATSYTYQNAIQRPWTRCYQALSAASDGLRELNAGLDLGSPEQNHRARAFARLVQGLALGYLAAYYDRAFILTEDLDINDPAQREELANNLQPYDVVIAQAVAWLEEAANLMETGPAFTTDTGWINGVQLTNVQLARVAHSYAARYLAQVARTPAERAAVDWNRVKSHAEQGVTEPFSVNGNGTTDTLDWWHSSQGYHSDRGGTWARVDYMMIGGADKSSGFQNWLGTPVAQRNEFEMDVDDLRIDNGTVDVNGNPQGLYILKAQASPFPAIRGTYHHSRYAYHRYNAYSAGGRLGPAVIFQPAENDFLIAEAMLHTSGSVAEIAAIIDQYRVTNGGYPPAASVTSGIGDIEDDRSPQDGSSLWAMLKYEKHMEILMTGAGVEFYDNRGWGDLVTNTALHWPIPAQELETLTFEIYSFGGGGVGSAPKNNPRELSPY